jgi:hypothetical protein
MGRRRCAGTVRSRQRGAGGGWRSARDYRGLGSGILNPGPRPD